MKTGRVVGHSDYVVLENAECFVSHKGVRRVRRDQKKSVCAYVKGELIETKMRDLQGLERLWFDPYFCESFYDYSGNRVKGARRIVLFETSAYAKDIEYLGDDNEKSLR
jgi:hypothetical protein